jgi:hypothetical protein
MKIFICVSLIIVVGFYLCMLPITMEFIRLNCGEWAQAIEDSVACFSGLLALIGIFAIIVIGDELI